MAKVATDVEDTFFKSTYSEDVELIANERDVEDTFFKSTYSTMWKCFYEICDVEDTFLNQPTTSF